MSKVVILGSGGQLGFELVREATQAGHEVKAFSRSDLDITNARAVEDALIAAVPDIVINAAAYNMVDVAEQEPLAAYQVNALAVRNIAVACRQIDARLVHFSTDYVFDGTAGRPYVETDAVHPVGAYAVSKLAGEHYARAYLDTALVIRVSGVFGPAGMRTARSNFVELMLRLAAGGKDIRVVEDHIASPTYAPAIASRTFQALALGATGVLHMGGGEAISWYEWAKMIFQQAALTLPLTATDEREYRTAARRPKFSALENARMKELGIEPMPPLADTLADYFARRSEFA